MTSVLSTTFRVLTIVIEMTTLARLGPILERRCHSGRVVATVLRSSSQGPGDDNSPGKGSPMVGAEELRKSEGSLTSESDSDELEEPTTCCMSGCANCVWIQYAERLSEKMANSDADIQKIIMDKVEDPNMRAFLSMELRCRNLVKP